MEKKPYPTTNKSPPPSQKKNPHGSSPCVCVARRTRANGQTMRKADVCVSPRLLNSKKLSPLVASRRYRQTTLGLGGDKQTNKHTNKQNHRHAKVTYPRPRFIEQSTKKSKGL